MVWRNEIITVSKQHKAISALLQSILFVGIFIAIWKTTSLIALFELDSHINGQLLRVVIAICLTPLFLTPFFMLYKSYKIDLFNDELTTSNDILFWTTRRTEKLQGMRTYTVVSSQTAIHSKKLTVKLNNKQIILSKQLHLSELDELSKFLEQHGFKKIN